jgi:hypothetical protein
MIPRFRPIFDAKAEILLLRFTAPALEIRRCRASLPNLFRCQAERTRNWPVSGPSAAAAGGPAAGLVPRQTGVPNGPDHCLRLSHGNTDLWVGLRAVSASSCWPSARRILQQCTLVEAYLRVDPRTAPVVVILHSDLPPVRPQLITASRFRTTPIPHHADSALQGEHP